MSLYDSHVRIEEQIAPHSMVGICQMYTGYCGSDSCDVVFIEKGTDVNALEQEMAYDNASSYGLEEDEDGIENDNIEGIMYKYRLSESGNYIGGGWPTGDINRICVGEKIVVLFNDGRGALVNQELLEQYFDCSKGVEIEFNTLCDYIAGNVAFIKLCKDSDEIAKELATNRDWL